jgi:glutaconate CoA-transferase subunit A
MTKLKSLEEAAALVPDGATIALGGLSLNGAPMAFVRELIRRGTRDLTVVSVVAGLPIDWLVAGGCVRRVISGLVSLEGFGLAPHHRAAVQRGEINMDEYSEHTLVCRLQAAAYRLPFVPTRAGLGTDMVTLHPDTTRVDSDPATGEQYVACTPLAVDFAIVHVNEADVEGNARMDPKLVWMDAELVKAAAATIVTAERIVDNSTFRARPGATTYPRFMVDAVAAAPWGAYPTSCLPEYGYDAAFLEEYSAASADSERWKTFWHERVVEPDGQGAFLDANGGARLLIDLARRSA